MREWLDSSNLKEIIEVVILMRSLYSVAKWSEKSEIWKPGLLGIGVLTEQQEARTTTE
jgi:hypothetical protein